MPEIWLNYGATDVVLDVRAENLEQRIDSSGDVLSDAATAERLGTMDLSKPMDLVVLHNSRPVQKIISSLFTICEQKSRPFPRILAGKEMMGRVGAGLPEGGSVAEFDSSLSDSNLVFLSEVEFDGLFGYETISTRLLRRFGKESMLSAYAKRRGNLPAPGQRPQSMEEARRFTDSFDIAGIELVANSAGIMDVHVGHPSKLPSASTLESRAIVEAGEHRALIVSTGRDSSNMSLGRSLSSLWNCYGAVKKDGLAVLVAECKGGLGSEGIQRHVEGRLDADKLSSPAEYVPGMEDLLFLSEVRKKFQVGLVSVLPELYAKKLGLVPLRGAKYSLDHILKTQGARQKISIVTDGARTLLR